MQAVEGQAGVYRYRLDFRDESGRRVHEVALERADFARAVEAAAFDALRRGLLPAYDPAPARARLEPRFARPGGGSPLAAGFDVVMPTPAGPEYRLGFDTRFFRTLGRRVGARLALAGRVPPETTLLFHLSAYLDRAEGRAAGALNIEVESVAPEIPVRPGSRRALGPTQAWDQPGPADFPVVIPRSVLEEAVAEARRAPDREVGGVLLGHLRRDEDTGEFFLEVTCTVPAEETEATAASVTFTHATWARAREVAAWRGEGETFVGWVHSHPFTLCAECPVPAPPECVSKVLFYSTDDEFLMELTFARPFMVGLLTAVEPRLEAALGHLPVKLFGWRNGLIEARGFEVIEA
jgi:proteasome lid subunit RPN8/RPN11